MIVYEHIPPVVLRIRLYFDGLPSSVLQLYISVTVYKEIQSQTISYRISVFKDRKEKFLISINHHILQCTAVNDYACLILMKINSIDSKYILFYSIYFFMLD